MIGFRGMLGSMCSGLCWQCTIYDKCRKNFSVTYINNQRALEISNLSSASVIAQTTEVNQTFVRHMLDIVSVHLEK